MMKAHGKLVTRKNKSVARGTLDDELVQSERRGGIEMGEIKDKSSEVCLSLYHMMKSWTCPKWKYLQRRKM